jgi:hypothetical protein
MLFKDLTLSNRPIIFGFILAIGITLIQPYLAFGASQSFGRSGSSGASRMHGHRFGFFGVDGLGNQGDQQVIIFSSLSLHLPPNLANLTKTEFTFSHAGWTAGMECRS